MTEEKDPADEKLLQEELAASNREAYGTSQPFAPKSVLEDRSFEGAVSPGGTRRNYADIVS